MKTIGDTRSLYTEHLMSILVPLIYEGILMEPCMKAFNYLERYEEASKENKNVETPGFDRLFQYFLQDFKKMSNTKIDDETRRIRTNSQYAEFFDDLIRIVVKSHIAVLRCSPRNNNTEIKEKFHETVDINLFIHKCYIESIKFLFYNPKLFYREAEFQKNGVDDMNFITYQMRGNKEIIFGHIRAGIQNALMQILPMRHIISDFLAADLEKVNDEYLEDIRDMVVRELQGQRQQERQQTTMGINMLEDGSDYNLDDLIFERKIEDTYNGEHVAPIQPAPKALSEAAQEPTQEAPRAVRHIEIDPKYMSAINSIKMAQERAAERAAAEQPVATVQPELSTQPNAGGGGDKVASEKKNDKPLSDKKDGDGGNEINIVRKLKDTNDDQNAGQYTYKYQDKPKGNPQNDTTDYGRR